MLARRIATGVLVVPVLLAAAFDDGWLFRLAILVFGILGTAEALWMARQAGHSPLFAFGFLVTLVILLDVLLAPGQVVLPGLGLLVMASLAVLLVRPNHQGSLVDWALTLTLPLYVAGLLQFFVALRLRADFPGPMTWPALVLAASWACDMAAFFAGRAWGRRRLAPSISPAKSREGALAGLLAATIVGVLLSGLTNLDPLRMAGFGLAVAVGSIVGDLAESLIKRQCGVKDSGVLMPGHGGILDRMDALLFSAGTAYFYLQMLDSLDALGRAAVSSQILLQALL